MFFAQGPLKTKKLNFQISTIHASDARSIESLFAFTLLADLQRSLNVKRRNRQDISDLKKKITELSFQSGILSEFTAFVGVSEVKVERRQIGKCCASARFQGPPPLPGKGANPPGKACALPGAKCAAPPPKCAFSSKQGCARPTRCSLAPMSPPPSGGILHSLTDYNDFPSTKNTNSSFSVVSLNYLVNSQKVAGFWEKTNEIQTILKVGYSFLLSSVVDVSALNSDQIERAEATCIVLAYLRTKESDSKNSWKLIEAKALKFLKRLISDASWESIISSIQLA
jgi:hypothetical protein